MMDDINADVQFDEAVDRVLDGTDPAAAAADLPETQALLELLPLLGRLSGDIPVPSPEPSKTRMLNEAAGIRKQSQARPFSRLFLFLRPAKRLALTGLAGLMILFAGLVFLGTSDDRMISRILPGEALYPAKRLGETIALNLPRNEAAQRSLEALLAGRRQEEIGLLQDLQREAQITFSGLVEAIDTDSILVSGIVCPLTCDHEPAHDISALEIVGNVQVGAEVVVEAFTLSDGSLHIASIIVQDP